MRDLEADLRICEQATPGPWTWEDDSCLSPGMVTVYAGRMGNDGSPWTPTHGLNLFGRLHPDASGKANLDFICQAREGWPVAIARALAAEVEVERLKAALEGGEKV